MRYTYEVEVDGRIEEIVGGEEPPTPEEIRTHLEEKYGKNPPEAEQAPEETDIETTEGTESPVQAPVYEARLSLKRKSRQSFHLRNMLFSSISMLLNSKNKRY